MKKLILMTFSVLIMGFSTQSKAGFYIDPYLGYTIGTIEQTITSGSASAKIDYSDSGVMYGARVGWQTFGLMVGVDYSMASGLEAEPSIATFSGVPMPTVKYDATYMGVFVGYELPFLLRAWATYHFDMDIDVADSSDDDNQGTGVAVGVGFTGLPFISLNLEYRMVDLDDANIDGYNSVLLSASLPLSL